MTCILIPSHIVNIYRRLLLLCKYSAGLCVLAFVSLCPSRILLARLHPGQAEAGQVMIFPEFKLIVLIYNFTHFSQVRWPWNSGMRSV